MYGNDIFLDRFNSLETAALFVDLGVYDAAFLSLRDDRVAEYLKMKGYVTQDQIDDLQCALNPLYCDSLTPKARLPCLSGTHKKTSIEVFFSLDFLIFNI